MRPVRDIPSIPTSLEARCDSLLLGRLGKELAQVYEGMLEVPLPSRLQVIIDRLDDDLRGHRQPPTGLDGGCRRR